MNEANEKHLIGLLDSIDTHLGEIAYELRKMGEVLGRSEVRR